MRHIQLNKYIVVISISIFFLILNGCCKDVINGTFYISEEARKYMPDTTIQSFQMIDQNGITDGFYINDRNWYSTHLYMNQWSEPDRCGEGFKTEDFGIAYSSTINDIFFMIVIRAQPEGTEFEIEWNQLDRIKYNFKTKEITSEQIADIQFVETIEINNKVYENVILFNLENILSDIDNQTPSKIYIAETYGLIKYETQNGIILERVVK